MDEATKFEFPQVQGGGRTQRTMSGEHPHTQTHDLRLRSDLPDIVNDRGPEPQQQHRLRSLVRQPSQSRQIPGQSIDNGGNNEEGIETSCENLWPHTPQSHSLYEPYAQELYTGSCSDMAQFEQITKLECQQSWR